MNTVLGILTAVVVAMAAAPTGAQMVAALHGDITYLNGGVGKEEADMLRQEAKRFPLEVQFVRRGAGAQEEFVADVRLRIIDRSGRVVLSMPGLGPIFLVQLPDGAYTIEAERESRKQTRSVEISSSQARAKVAFVW